MQTPAPRVWKIWQGHWGLWHTSDPDRLGVSLFLSFFKVSISEILFLNLHLSPQPELISQFTSRDLSSRTRSSCHPDRVMWRVEKPLHPTWASQCHWGPAAVKHKGYKVMHWRNLLPILQMVIWLPPIFSPSYPSCSPANLLRSHQAHISLSLASTIDASEIMIKIHYT